MMSANRVTLRDIAAVAGVSVSTVSRVLNGGGRVAPKTRERIHSAAERLEFHPNALAQFFATGRSHTVAVLAQKASGTFSMPLILGIINRLAQDDIAVLVYNAIEADVSSRPENIKKLNARQVDGVIVAGDGNDRTFSSISSVTLAPVVYAFGVSDNPEDTAFVPDDVMAGRLAAEHLLERGCTRVAHVTGTRHSLAVRNRELGIREVLGEAGVKFVVPTIYADWTREGGRVAAEQLLPWISSIDAVICGNDFLAMGLSQVLKAHGVKVPDDVAIVGHDAWEQYIGDVPEFTSVNPLLDRIGVRAAEHVLATIESGASGSGVHVEPCELVLGSSS